MSSIIIREFGPIKNVELPLKRFNFFIGRQSSGKSTIAKVISFCSWLEKEIMTHPNLREDLPYYEKVFQLQLEEFHSMHGYFREATHIEYTTEFLTITYKAFNCLIRIGKKTTYERCKILYIPAERSYAVRHLVQTKENNIKSFSNDYESAKDFYWTKRQKFDLLNLNIQFYQELNQGEMVSRLKSVKDDYEINLEDASSGLQSIVPAAVAVDYYSRWFFSGDNESRTLSVRQEKDRKDVRNYIKNMSNLSDAAKENMTDRLLRTHKTAFVIEEPEQNLYPSTQRELLNFMIARCVGKRKHSLTITTHSPYIINQLNLLFKAFDTKTLSNGAALNYDEVNVFAVDNGMIRDLKLKNEGVHLIDTVRLSEDMNDIYEEYNELGK